MLTFVLVTATLVAVYWFWIRPILKSRPALHEFYEREESLFAAFREKLKGIKQKLSSAIVIIASAAISAYDFLTPIVSGVDVSSIATNNPRFWTSRTSMSIAAGGSDTTLIFYQPDALDADSGTLTATSSYGSVVVQLDGHGQLFVATAG